MYMILVLVCILGSGHTFNLTNASSICEANVTVDKLTPPSCASCSEQCGRTVDLYSRKSCSCDPQCIMFNDCCHDFRQLCPKQHKDGRGNTRFPGETPTCERIEVNKGLDSRPRYMIINKCRYDKEACIKSIDTPYSYIPVLDVETRLSYVNIKCALCNKARNPKPWKTIVRCKQGEIDVRNQSTPIRLVDKEALLIEAISKPVSTATCVLESLPPRRATTARRCYHSDVLVSSCLATCKNSYLIQACVHGPVNYFNIHGIVYKNYYCMRCNQIQISQCKTADRHHKDNIKAFLKYSMPILFDFDPRDGLMVGQRKVGLPSCPQNHRWNQFQCQPEKITYKTEIGENVDERNKLRHPGLEWVTKIKERLLCLISNHNIKAEMIKFNINSETLNITMYYCYKNYNISDELETDITNETEKVLTSYNVSLKFYVHFMKGNLPKSLTVDQYGDNILKNMEYGTPLNLTLYYNINQSTCEDLALVGHGISYELGITTLILLIISTLALLVRILLHCFMPELQNPASRVQICLAVAMLMALSSLLVSPWLPPGSTLCHVGGAVSHWTLLSMFFWMTAVSGDVWRMVWLSSRFCKITHKKETFIKMSVFAWGIPTLIILVSEILNIHSPDLRFRPQYGRKLCWFNQRLALLVLFALPVAVSLATNLVLFIMSAIHLHRNKATASSQSGRTGYSYSLYLKLFILMGLTWIVGIIAEVSKEPILFYVFTIMNASQGFLLTLGSLLSTQTRGTLQRRFKDSVTGRYFSRRSSSKNTQESMI